ncbi:hypothetical protein [Streptomyces sp. NPDC005322]|uniref:hypothetical protein n=1 Tax=Streptomyces sp. NPDC005322 TaxID=3157032 RepID=UPI0033B1E61F
MPTAEDLQRGRQLLGEYPEAADWCRIKKIPKPPKEVHAAAGGGRLKPGVIRPLALLGYIVGAPFLIVIGGAWMILEAVPEIIFHYLFYTKKKREQDRRNREDAARRKAAIAEHRLDRVFDGDWNAAAGQLLLRWYGHSSHPTRLLLQAPGRTVIAGPPGRVSTGAGKKIQILAEIPRDQAIVEDPLDGMWKTGKLRIRFRDGSWIVVETDLEGNSKNVFK